MAKSQPQSRGKSRGSRGPSSRSKSRSRSRPKKSNLKCVSSSIRPPCQGHVHNKPAGWLLRLLDYDRRLSRWLHEQGLRLFFYLSLRTLEFSCDWICLIPAAAATYLLPKEKLTPEVRMFFFNLLGAFIVDLVIVTLIKNYIRLARPSYCQANLSTVEVEQLSVPCGHSTRALTVVTFFTMYLPMWKDQAVNIWLPFLRRLLCDEVNILDDGVHMFSNLLVSIITWVVFTWAVATTSSRIILGRHFFFDVLVGCLVGILESTLYNNFLVIPREVSEGVHAYVTSCFATIEDGIRKRFSNDGSYLGNLDSQVDKR